MTRTAPRPSALLLALFGATLLVLAAALGLARGAMAAEAEGPLVVKIHADWCGTCRAMTPSWDRAAETLGGDARFVVLDVTGAEQVEASRREAEALGIEAFFEGYKAKTGTVGILGADGKPAQTFKGEVDLDALRAALASAGA